MANFLDLLNLFSGSASPLLEEFLKGTSGVLSHLHFKRYTGSQVEPAPDRKYRSVSSVRIQEFGLSVTFHVAFLDADGQSHTITGTRTLASGKNAQIEFDGALVSDTGAVISFKEHVAQGSLQVNFEWRDEAGTGQIYRIDGYLT